MTTTRARIVRLRTILHREAQARRAANEARIDAAGQAVVELQQQIVDLAGAGEDLAGITARSEISELARAALSSLQRQQQELAATEVVLAKEKRQADRLLELQHEEERRRQAKRDQSTLDEIAARRRRLW